MRAIAIALSDVIADRGMAEDEEDFRGIEQSGCNQQGGRLREES